MILQKEVPINRSKCLEIDLFPVLSWIVCEDQGHRVYIILFVGVGCPSVRLGNRVFKIYSKEYHPKTTSTINVDKYH